jgi:hypothetical protein
MIRNLARGLDGCFVFTRRWTDAESGGVSELVPKCVTGTLYSTDWSGTTILLHVDIYI